MSSSCPECDRLWANYSAAYMLSCDVSKSKEADENAKKAADLEWDLARMALTQHVATHPTPGSAEPK